jgi:hypothetical protein
MVKAQVRRLSARRGVHGIPFNPADRKPGQNSIDLTSNPEPDSDCSVALFRVVDELEGEIVAFAKIVLDDLLDDFVLRRAVAVDIEITRRFVVIIVAECDGVADGFSRRCRSS